MCELMCQVVTLGRRDLLDARLPREVRQVVKPLCALGFAGHRIPLTQQAADRADVQDADIRAVCSGLTTVEDRDQGQVPHRLLALPSCLAPLVHLIIGLAELCQAARAVHEVCRTMTSTTPALRSAEPACIARDPLQSMQITC